MGEVGFKQAMQCKWLGMVKGAEPRVERKVDAIEDTAVALLTAIAAGTEIPAKELENLVKKRKLVKQEAWKSYTISKVGGGAYDEQLSSFAFTGFNLRPYTG